jgi:hypothetical protein
VSGPGGLPAAAQHLADKADDHQQDAAAHPASRHLGDE